MSKLLGNDAGTLRTTPWARREVGGIYVGHDKSVWLYRELPLAPLQYEDPAKRLEVGRLLDDALDEIGSRSRDIGQGLSMLSQNRSIHLFSATFDMLSEVPPGTPEPLEEFLGQLLPPLVGGKTLLFGVKLRSSLLEQAAKASGGMLDKVKAVMATRGDNLEMSLNGFDGDFADMDNLFKRLGCSVPRAESLSQLEAWWNAGQTPDHVNEFGATSFRVPQVGTYEIHAVQEFPQQMQAPFSQWLLDAMTHPSPAVAVSIRAELEPHTVTRTRLRRQRRRLIAQEEEEAATGDLGREENSSVLEYAKDVESMVVNSRTPFLANASILMARIVDGADTTFAHMLAESYRIKTQVLELRQLEALDEFQPASSTRVNPFPQDLNLAMLAYAGLAGYSNLGDGAGVFLGHIDPDHVPCWIDPFGAAKNDLPPVWFTFGDPGSGKTFTAQLVAGQAALAGISCFFINPKPNDSLKPWVDWLRSQGVPGRTVSLSKMQAGALDPFSFCWGDPRMAGEILVRHILTIFGDAITLVGQLNLTADIHSAVEAGVRCGVDALDYVQDPDLAKLIRDGVRSMPLLALAFASAPHDEWKDNAGLTLIEFDRELGLPTQQKDNPDLTERQALATLSLTSRAAMEVLMRANGGVYVVDEAHHYIRSAEGRSSLERLGREGRSMGILPIFVTQKPKDLLEIDMESFMSRVLCMKLNDPEQARAALELCRLEPTKSRVEFLREAGPRRGSDGIPGRPALGILRDLYDRHAVVSIGPVPEELRLAMSTNRTDRELRDAQAPAPGAVQDPSMEVQL